MANEHAPLRSVDAVEDEHLISPLSSAGSPSVDSRGSHSQTFFSTSGYEPINLNDGNTEAATEEVVEPPQAVVPRSSTGSPGVHPDHVAHMASSNSLRRKPVSNVPHASSSSSLSSESSLSKTPHHSGRYLDSPETSEGTSPRGRFSWGAAPRFTHAFRKLRPRGRVEPGVEPSRQTVEPNRTPDVPGPFSSVTERPSSSGAEQRPSSRAGHPSSSETEQGSASPSDVDIELAEKDVDDEAFDRGFGEPPRYCSSRENVTKRWGTWLPVAITFLSIYSTFASIMWFAVSIRQPEWGHVISSKGTINLSTATTITALLAKTIELSFVTVFISVLGQILTHRSFSRRRRGGMTLAEMTMRNWVVQPGSLITNWEVTRYKLVSILGVFTTIATFTSMLYTTASEAMVSPKLMDTEWQERSLSGPVAASYANIAYMRNVCPDMFGATPRIPDNDLACMQIQFSSQSHGNLFAFMSTWASIKANGTAVAKELKDRPTGKHVLFDNTTMTASWVDTEHDNVTAKFEQYGRIVNNVTTSMPHPGVYAAAMAPENKIMQPAELGGVGKYTIRASVVSPTLNVMCVNMNDEELAPLVYERWPNANTTSATVGFPKTWLDGWTDSVPLAFDEEGKAEYLNRTVVDDIFRWGPDYKRRPPVFPLFPSDYNMVVNSTLWNPSDAIYLLAKSPGLTNYTLCEMRSWVSPSCYTEFNSSGTSGTSMEAVCGARAGIEAYSRFVDEKTDFPGPSGDWKVVADQWRLALDLNGGTTNNNATNAHELTQLILQQPRFLPDQPSMAEALAVFAIPSLVDSAIKTPYRHYWDYQSPQLTQDKSESFRASITTQQYKSGHALEWQFLFYFVLGPVALINLFCFAILVVFIYRRDFVTDYTEPQNLFALAMNSPPSLQLKGACGGGPTERDFMVPWRVAYASSANHYFLKEANDTPWRGKYAKKAAGVDPPREEDEKVARYKRLSSGGDWLTML